MPDEAIFLLYLIFPAALGQGFTQFLTEMITRHIRIIMFLGSKVRPVRRADKVTTICKPIV
jgi:hypothetical protein